MVLSLIDMNQARYKIWHILILNLASICNLLSVSYGSTRDPQSVKPGYITRLTVVGHERPNR